MDMKQFCNEVIEKLKDRYGKGWEITITYIPKNNGIVKAAFLIKDNNNKITPTIYAEHFYEMYEQGATLEEIIESIIDLYNCSDKDVANFDISFIDEWDKVKERLAVKVVNKNRNMNYLEPLIWREFFDLAIIPIVVIDREDNSFLQTMKVTQDLLMLWEKDKDDLIDIAIENNKRLFGTSCKNISEFIPKFTEMELELDDISDDIPMIILSNKVNVNGASAILDTETLKVLYSKLNRDFYILPSSVHEIICLPVDGKPAKDVQEMVKDVNATQVSVEEFLSNNVYLFDGNKVTMVTSDESEGLHV